MLVKEKKKKLPHSDLQVWAERNHCWWVAGAGLQRKGHGRPRAEALLAATVGLLPQSQTWEVSLRLSGRY